MARWMTASVHPMVAVILPGKTMTCPATRALAQIGACMSNELTLYSYWRSSAAWRVRIALNLKGMDYTLTPVHLLRDGGEQRSAIFRELNPQALIPILIDGDRVIRQSQAIIEYLEEAYPETPRLLPIDNRARARVRAIAQMVACDIHPLGNLRVQQYLEKEFAASEAQRQTWTQHWIVAGFDALEAVLAGHPGTGRSAKATRRPSRTAAWCRRSTTRAASAWTWRRIPSSRASARRAIRCKPSRPPRRKRSRMLRNKSLKELECSESVASEGRLRVAGAQEPECTRQLRSSCPIAHAGAQNND